MTSEGVEAGEEWPLHLACRTGNLKKAQYLVETCKFPVNEADSFDATPLYLAALTGNHDICRYLLEHGATCDPEGDAARIFYVALTPELRRLLKEWSLSAATKDPFVELFRKSFNAPMYSDCIMKIEGETFHLHRVILYSRCPLLAKFMVQSSDEELEGRFRLVIPDHHENGIMIKILEYLYSGYFETTDVEIAWIAIDMARFYGLDTLEESLLVAAEKFDDGHGRFRCETEDACHLRADMRGLARIVTSPRTMCDGDPSWWKVARECSDRTVSCLDERWHLHASLLCSQSDYFRCAFDGHFREAGEGLLDLSRLVPDPGALRLAIQWIYCDEFLDRDVSEARAINVLELGSALLCQRLCAYVSNSFLIPSLDPDNVFSMLGLSKRHSLERLERGCVEVLADNLWSLAHSADLLEVFASEVATTEQGGDIRVVDVPIAAEIRSSIMKKQIMPEQERMEMLRLLQGIVNEATRGSPSKTVTIP